MTTPVITRKTQADGEKMEMTTPVITKRVCFVHGSYISNIFSFRLWHLLCDACFRCTFRGAVIKCIMSWTNMR